MHAALDALRKMDNPKSSRHSKITGNFGEALILYWLSKQGYECALIDHTGIDIIARDPNSTEVLGISVKSRSRLEGTEQSHVNIMKTDIRKAEEACKSFHCVPYFAIVIDARKRIHGYLLSSSHLLELCPGGTKVSAWPMTTKRLEQYAVDACIKSFVLAEERDGWAKGV